MHIRTANISDIKALTSLMEQLGYPMTEDQMTGRLQALAVHPSYHTLVAEMDGHVVGMAGLCQSLFYEHDGCYVRIQAFVVDAQYRRKGIGQKLLEAIECWAVEQGASAIVLNSGEAERIPRSRRIIPRNRAKQPQEQRNRAERNAVHQFYKQHGFVEKSTGFSKKLQ